MLNLNAEPQVWVTHEETGTEYLIKPISPAANQKLIKRSRDKKQQFDSVIYNGLVVDAAVVEWKRVGDPTTGELPATEENKRKLGEKFSGIANFIFEQATDIKHFIEEEDAAKND